MKGAEFVKPREMGAEGVLPKSIAVAFVGTGDAPMRPTQMTDEEWMVQLSKLRKERDLWQSMHRNQCGVNEPLHKLAADQKELIEGLRVQVNQFERLLGFIPCTGDFDRACEWVKQRRDATPEGTNESHCVAIWERFPKQEMTILFCDNCKMEVARLSDEEALLQGFRNADSCHEYWNAAFKKHTAPKEPALTPAPVVNPNAGQVQAYPNGRWASKEEGGA